MDLVLYIALGVGILFAAVPSKRYKESELSDCKSLELENAKLDHLKVVDITVNEWLMSLLMVSSLYYLHRWIRGKKTQVLLNQMKDSKYLQDTKQFADVCSKALNALDESMKINEELCLLTLSNGDFEETDTEWDSTAEDTDLVEDLSA